MPTAELENEFWQSTTAKLKNRKDSGKNVLLAKGSTKKAGNPTELNVEQFNSFFGISFTHHITLLNKFKDIKERFFYMQLAAGEMLSVAGMEHHIAANTFKKLGKLPNNFKSILPAEHAGKLNFYLNLLDDKAKLKHEKPSIGIILCKEKTNKEVEYSFRNINKAMGVATYKLSREVPKELKDVLPNAEQLKKLF